MALARFTPAYWAVNFGPTAAASVVTTNSTSILVTCNFRMYDDLIGLYWYSTDTYSHGQYLYATNNDYSTATLDFDFVLSGTIRALDQLNAPTLTVTHTVASGLPQDFVRLSTYVTSGTMQAGHITLDFASVMGGFDSDEPIDWTTVDNLQISIVTTVYDPANSGPLPTPLVGTVALNNIAVTGPTLAQNSNTYTQHSLRMTDGYDDSYPQTPTRFVQQMWNLGYRSWYSIYMGISHYHDLVWDAGESRLVVNPSGSIINDATTAWFTSLFIELFAFGYTTVVVSVSFEIVDYLMPDDWCQRDYQGNPGLSGWSPPSEFVSPCNFTALSYLANVVKTVFATAGAADFNFVVQMGEPWWWDNSFTNNAPCFYDAATTAAYPVQTGQPVPTPLITSNQFNPTSAYTAWLDWLQLKLGLATHFVINSLMLVEFSLASTALLFYTPQIFESNLMRTVNLPITQWRYPNFEILQVEDYQWVIDGDWADHATTWTTANVTLGYPFNQIHYFSGFNLLPAQQDSIIWSNVFLAVRDGFLHNCAQVWEWARPEIFRDDIIYEPSATQILFDNLSVVCQPQQFDDFVMLRWSDDRGATWSYPVMQSIRRYRRIRDLGAVPQARLGCRATGCLKSRGRPTVRPASRARSSTTSRLKPNYLSEKEHRIGNHSPHFQFQGRASVRRALLRRAGLAHRHLCLRHGGFQPQCDDRDYGRYVGLRHQHRLGNRRRLDDIVHRNAKQGGDRRHLRRHHQFHGRCVLPRPHQAKPEWYL